MRVMGNPAGPQYPSTVPRLINWTDRWVIALQRARTVLTAPISENLGSECPALPLSPPALGHAECRLRTLPAIAESRLLRLS